MGGSGSKAPAQQQPTAAAAAAASQPTSDAHEVKKAAGAAKTSAEGKYDNYRRFRDELFSFSLGESAFDFAEQLFTKEPESPEVMALLAETTVEYDKTKNKVFRDHWCDRLDLLQHGVDVSRKCINEHPDFGPCYRTYVLCATREAEALYKVRRLQGLGLLENYRAIVAKGEKAMELLPDDADVPNALAALCARCAYRWYDPTRLYAMWYGVPSARKVLQQSIQYSLKAVEKDPKNLEYACRLAQAYFQSGDFANARRWYVKVRDEMPPQSLKDERWQGVAHTQLSTAFVQSKWNVPFA